MTGIIVDGVRLGTIASFAGNSRAERWVAWSIHRKSASEENRSCFPTMHAGIDWLKEEHERHVAEAVA